MNRWPGFDPAAVPVAVFDGERTVLTGHPDPPPEFVHESAGTTDRWVYPGLHPGVRANAVEQIGGVDTATVYGVHSNAYGVHGNAYHAHSEPLDSAIAHESFHVFQRRRHPKWPANEVHAFAYPVDDPELLRLRRMEATALRRAVVDQSPGWTVTALRLRAERFARLPEFAVRYERTVERHEGTARYIEGRRQSLDGLKPTLAADDVRRAFYDSGEALALLLDGFVPNWKDRLEDDDEQYLDDLLGSVEAVPEEFTDAEWERFQADAVRAVDQLRERRAALRTEFFTSAGRTRLTATDDGFRCTGFDPMNVRHLGGGEVLHTRWLKLSGSGFDLELLDAQALTEGPPDNPVFGGIRRVHL